MNKYSFHILHLYFCYFETAPSSCELYCVLSDSDSNFCGDVLMKASERRDKRYEKEKEREHRKKMEEIKKQRKE